MHIEHETRARRSRFMPNMHGGVCACNGTAWRGSVCSKGVAAAECISSTKREPERLNSYLIYTKERVDATGTQRGSVCDKVAAVECISSTKRESDNLDSCLICTEGCARATGTHRESVWDKEMAVVEYISS
jgi:hypothetical protein